jgi:hypothetical protein
MFPTVFRFFTDEAFFQANWGWLPAILVTLFLIACSIADNVINARG